LCEVGVWVKAAADRSHSPPGCPRAAARAREREKERERERERETQRISQS
jgi:hypothetical protein